MCLESTNTHIFVYLGQFALAYTANIKLKFFADKVADKFGQGPEIFGKKKIGPLGVIHILADAQ